jgi:hypothetical protein
MEKKMSDSMEMPKYQSHKKVWALKIGAISVHADGSYGIHPESPLYGEITVSSEWLLARKAYVGGYYVVYDDGYQSFSPAGVFEAGYTLIEK